MKKWIAFMAAWALAAQNVCLAGSIGASAAAGATPNFPPAFGAVSVGEATHLLRLLRQANMPPAMSTLLSGIKPQEEAQLALLGPFHQALQKMDQTPSSPDEVLSKGLELLNSARSSAAEIAKKDDSTPRQVWDALLRLEQLSPYIRAYLPEKIEGLNAEMQAAHERLKLVLLINGGLHEAAAWAGEQYVSEYEWPVIENIRALPKHLRRLAFQLSQAAVPDIPPD